MLVYIYHVSEIKLMYVKQNIKRMCFQVTLEVVIDKKRSSLFFCFHKGVCRQLELQNFKLILLE